MDYGIPVPGTLWKHRKGGLYLVEAIACGCGGPIEQRLQVVYRSMEGTVWVRDLAEFTDGRFTPAENTEPPCGAQLFIHDDHGDNSATMKCELPLGHPGPHKEGYFHDEKTNDHAAVPAPITVTWTRDERLVCERHGPLDGSRGENRYSCKVCDDTPIRCSEHGLQAYAWCHACEHTPYVCPVHGEQKESYCRVDGCSNEPDFTTKWTKVWPEDGTGTA